MTNSKHSLLLLVLLLQSSILIRAQACYFPNGTPSSAQALDWEPCNPGAAHSACCESTHVCLSSGLCYDTIWNHVIRGACTDPTFADSACPQFCLDSPPNSLADMRQCNGQNVEWTCALDPSDCANPFTVEVGQVKDYRTSNQAIIAASPITVSSQTPLSSPTTNAATTSAISGTSTAASAGTHIAPGSSAAATSGSKSALTVGLGAGLGVGLPLLIALATALFFLFRARKEIRHIRNSQRSELGSGGAYHDTSVYGFSQRNKGPPSIPAPQYQSPAQSSQRMPQLTEISSDERRSRAELS